MFPFEHPAVRAAIDRETEVRDAAFLGLPYLIEGETLQPFTLAHYLRLQLAGNAFVCGGEPVASDAAMFLYVVTNQTGDPASYAEGIAGKDFIPVCEGITGYLKETFFDAPPATGATNQFVRSYYSIAATLCDAMGKEYGWTVAETMNTPLAVLFQMLRASLHRTNPDIPQFNALSDRALMEAAHV